MAGDMWIILLLLIPCLLIINATEDVDQVEHGMCQYKGDLVFVVDSSGSIEDQGRGNWQKILKFMEDIVDSLIIGPDSVRVGAVRFSQEATNIFYLKDTRNKAEVKSWIRGIAYDGLLTATGDGLEFMRIRQFNAENGDRPFVPNIAIVITDGESNMYPSKTHSQAELAHEANIKVISVGIGEKVNEAELAYISSPPHIMNLTYFTTTNFTTLSTLLSILDFTICSFLKVEFPDTSDGIKDATFPITPRTPRTPDFSGQMPCPFSGDLVIMLDSTIGNSVKKDWEKVTNFIAELVNFFEVDRNGVRLGMVRFSNSAVNIWTLDQTFYRERTIDAILTLQSNEGATNMYDALRQMRMQQFQITNGDRAWLPNVALMITDGTSNVMQERTYSEATLAHASGINILAVGIGNQVNKDELKGVTSQTSFAYPNVFLTNNIEDLSKIVIPLKNRICTTFGRYPVTPIGDYVTNTENWKSSHMTTPPLTTHPFMGEADVVFVFDASNSVLGPEEINSIRYDGEAKNIYAIQQEDIVIPFVQELLMKKAFVYTNNRAHVGVICFGDWAVHNRYFNGHTYEPPYFYHHDIQNCPFVGGQANIANALEAARTVQFTPYRGHRLGSQKVVVFFLHGFGLAGQDEEKLKEEVRLAQEMGIRVYAVDISGRYKTKYLEMISKHTKTTGRKSYWGVADLNSAGELAIEMTDTKNLMYPTDPKTSAIKATGCVLHLSLSMFYVIILSFFINLV